MRLRDDHAFEQHKARVSAILDDLGDIRVEDSAKRATIRRFEIEADAPRPPLTARVRFRYLEWWSRDGRGWQLGRYQYDYFDRVERGRLAYHRHNLPGAPDLHHVHCEPSGGRPLARHFRAYEVDLLEAHEEFAALYASGRAIDCAGLRPLQLHEKGTDR
ncbi:MAG: hypothetical protein ACXWXV_11505 [Aeromicrobium sp.]